MSISNSGIDLGGCYFKDSKDIDYIEGGNVDILHRKVVDYINCAEHPMMQRDKEPTLLVQLLVTNIKMTPLISTGMLVELLYMPR